MAIRHIPATSHSDLMELPAELRLMIFSFLLRGHIVDLRGTKAATVKTYVRSMRPSISILRTCRQINVEATPIFFSQNTFSANCTAVLGAFLLRTEAKVSFLKHLRVTSEDDRVWPIRDLALLANCTNVESVELGTGRVFAPKATEYAADLMPLFQMLYAKHQSVDKIFEVVQVTGDDQLYCCWRMSKVVPCSCMIKRPTLTTFTDFLRKQVETTLLAR